MNRREVLISGAAAFAAGIRPVWAQAPKEVLIGALFPLTGSAAQTGVDAQHALNTAAEIINSPHILDLPLGAGAGLPGLGGAKVRIIYADHQSDPQKGRAEAERLITQEKVAALIGTYQSSVAVTVSQTAERYEVPFMSADNSSPSLHRRGLKYFFRPAAHDEMFSAAMFDFFDALRKKGQKIETLALFHEDTIFGTDSAKAQARLAGERGYKIATDIRYQTNTASLSAEVQQLKAANADVLMPSSYTNDSILLVKTMVELGYKPKAIVAQDAGFSEKTFYDAVGDKIPGSITRGSFSLDLTAKRPSVGAVNALFKARSNKDLNDLTSREFTAFMVLADAIDRAKSTDGAKIREALVATNVPGERTIMPWKQIKFDESGQNNDAGPILLQYLNGKLVTIFPFSAAATEPVWPMNA
jgi:branched-chain amino acid transport system substrate-binding protein